MKPTVMAARASAPHAAFARLRRAVSRLFLPGLGAMAVAAAMFFCAPVTAQPASVDKNFPLPPTLTGFKKGEITDFESKKPGLGQSVNYARQGWRADIYIYDLGLKSILSGPKSNVIAKQMEQAKQDIFGIQKAGHYSEVKMKASFDITNAAGKPVFSCLSLQLVRKDMGATDSYLCLTGSANKFVKVRLSTAQAANSEEIAKRFVTELAGIIPVR